METEAPPQATHGAAQISQPWGLSWETALELPGEAFQGQDSLKDTGLLGGGCFHCFPPALKQEEACRWQPVPGTPGSDV